MVPRPQLILHGCKPRAASVHYEITPWESISNPSNMCPWKGRFYTGQGQDSSLWSMAGTQCPCHPRGLTLLCPPRASRPWGAALDGVSVPVHPLWAPAALPAGLVAPLPQFYHLVFLGFPQIQCFPPRADEPD